MSSEGASERLAILSNAQISAALESHAIIISQNQDGEPLLSEGYCNGRFQIGGTRVPLYGTYRIADGLMCTTTGEGDRAQESCARIYRDTSGRLYRRYIDAPTATLVHINAVPMQC